MRRMASLLAPAILLLAASVGAAGAAPKTPPGDPPGNNGTIKVTAEDSVADPGKEPQIDGSTVWVVF